MDALITSTLKELLQAFAVSMTSEGKPNKSFMEAKLQSLCDEAVAQRDRKIIMLIKGYR